MAGGTALPISIQGMALPRDKLEIDVQKMGDGVYVVYARSDQKGLEAENIPEKCRSQFPEHLSVILGTPENHSDSEIPQRHQNVTASLFRDHDGPSWNARLTAYLWRAERNGEVKTVVVLADDPSWEGIGRLPYIPEGALPVSATWSFLSSDPVRIQSWFVSSGFFPVSTVTCRI
jgi:hypothetical protein